LDLRLQDVDEDDDGSTAKIHRRAPRRDTVPVPPIADTDVLARDVQANDEGARAAPRPTLDMSTAYLSPFPWRPLPPPVLPKKRPVEEAIVDDILDASGLDDDATQASSVTFTPTEEPTSPTLPLAARSASAREVYRLFLASDYPSALALANALVAQGDSDSMLSAIARECRESLENGETRAPHESPLRLFAGISGNTTLDQLAATTGLSLDQLLNLLERFVSMGVLTLRPPAR
jgi:hypothetical protein